MKAAPAVPMAPTASLLTDYVRLCFADGRVLLACLPMLAHTLREHGQPTSIRRSSVLHWPEPRRYVVLPKFTGRLIRVALPSEEVLDGNAS